MGCLRSGVIVLLTASLGGLIGWGTGDSLIPVPGWLVRIFVRDERVDTALDLARTAGKVWGGLNGAFFGLLIGIAFAVFLAYRAKRR